MSKYNEMLANSGATVGQGMQALATIASSGGNSLKLDQGHAELSASSRKPIHPGHNASIDMLGGANFIKDGLQ